MRSLHPKPPVIDFGVAPTIGTGGNSLGDGVLLIGSVYGVRSVENFSKHTGSSYTYLSRDLI